MDNSTRRGGGWHIFFWFFRHDKLPYITCSRVTRETPHVTPRVTTYTRGIQFYILVLEVNNQKYLFMRRPCLCLKRINLDG